MTADRSQIARIAANTRWAYEENRSAATAPARDAMQRKFENEVDPHRQLAPEELAKRVAAVKKAHYGRIARKSAQVRAARKAERLKPSA